MFFQSDVNVCVVAGGCVGVMVVMVGLGGGGGLGDEGNRIVACGALEYRRLCICVSFLFLKELSSYQVINMCVCVCVCVMPCSCL